jgi:hypothetical protein
MLGDSDHRRRLPQLVSVQRPLDFFTLAFGSVTTLLCLLVRGSVVEALGQRYWMLVILPLEALLFTILIGVIRLLRAHPRIFAAPAPRRGGKPAASPQGRRSR